MGYGLSVISSAYQHTVTSAAQTYESYNTSQQQSTALSVDVGSPVRLALSDSIELKIV